jgi:PAS domain S-box-containing protein
MNDPLKILLVGNSVTDPGLLHQFLSGRIPGCIVKEAMTETVFQRKLNEFKPDIVLCLNNPPLYYSSQTANTGGQYPPVMLYMNHPQQQCLSCAETAAAVHLINPDEIVTPGTETVMKHAQETIRFNASLLNAVGQAAIATDTHGTVKYWNSASENTYGWLTEEALGKNIIELLVPQQSQEQSNSIMERLLSGNSWTGEFLVQHKNGTVFPIEVTDSPLFDKKGNINGIIGISFDISERKKAAATERAMEERIAHQKIQEQKKISRAIIKAQEEEKNHLGKELHDNINQILASTKIFLSLAAKRNAELKQLLEYPIELLNNSIEEIRNLTYKQVTPIKNIQLEQQIEKLLLNLTEDDTQKVHFTYSLQESLLADELKLNIYRIIQEQLSNILKHAAAKHITIAVLQIADSISIRIEDDGKGFDTTQNSKGIGIINMRNRVETYDGKLEIKSSAGNGCILNVSFPLL